ncbi:MAG: hypothetical protein LV480_12660 [Methylacidiphilales bacterium]|nr:hypothetical protein [Candidatus Methylacidiphilales bacterium]
MSTRANLLVALAAYTLGTPLMAAEVPIPPVTQLNEIDVDFSGNGFLYFTRIFPNGSASLCFASQLIGWCPPKTYDFVALYSELSALPEVPHTQSKFAWTASFLRIDKNAQVQTPVRRAIEDPKIVLPILKRFVNGTMSKQYLLKRFSDCPALPSTDNAILLGL